MVCPLDFVCRPRAPLLKFIANSSGRYCEKFLTPREYADEHSEQARTPHTNGPKDVPLYGDFSLQQKPLYYRGIHLNSCPAYVYAGVGSVVACARILVHEIRDRGAHAAVRGGVRCAPQVLDRGAQVDARGAAQVLQRGAKAVACGAAR